VAQSSIRKISDRVVRLVANLLKHGWPLALFEAFNWVFNYPFCALMLLLFGPIRGAVIIAVAAFSLNAFVFWLYEYMKIDWLGAHAIRELADKTNKSRLEKILTWHHKPRNTVLEKIAGELQFCFLLSQIDPVIVAIHYRQSHFDGLGWRDWRLFIKATSVGLAIWLAVMEPAVWGARMVFG